VNCRRLFPQAEFISAEDVKLKGPQKGRSALLGEGFTVIDVGDNRKVADVLLLHMVLLFAGALPLHPGKGRGPLQPEAPAGKSGKRSGNDTIHILCTSSTQ
jgi:hypothetical protein